MRLYKREKLFDWIILFKRFTCVLMKGHKFPRRLVFWNQFGPWKYNKEFEPILGKRSDLRCLRCDQIFYTKKAYKKGKHRK